MIELQGKKKGGGSTFTRDLFLPREKFAALGDGVKKSREIIQKGKRRAGIGVLQKSMRTSSTITRGEVSRQGGK